MAHGPGREGFYLENGGVVEAVIAAAAAASPTFAACVPGWRRSGGAGAVLLSEGFERRAVNTIFSELAIAAGVAAGPAGQRRRITIRTSSGPARIEIARAIRRVDRDRAGPAAAVGAGPGQTPVPAGPPRALSPAGADAVSDPAAGSSVVGVVSVVPSLLGFPQADFGRRL